MLPPAPALSSHVRLTGGTKGPAMNIIDTVPTFM